MQDNMSAIRMEKNGRNSCTGNSRHIDIRYFWVKDRVDKKELEIKYCPTHIMIADYFTKPLQGKLFHRLREVIMGWKHIDTLNDMIPPKRLQASFPSSISKEHVGKTSNVPPKRVDTDDVIEEREPLGTTRRKTYAEMVNSEHREQ